MDLARHSEITGEVLSTLFHELAEESLRASQDLPHLMLLNYPTEENSSNTSAWTILVSHMGAKLSYRYSVIFPDDVLIQLAMG